MIEVKGTDEVGQPLIMAFDGRVLEIFGWLSGKLVSKRFHVDHLKTIELQGKDDKPSIIYLELNFPVSFGTYEFTSGGENLPELVEAVNQAMVSVF